MWNTITTPWHVGHVPHTTIGGTPKLNPNMIFKRSFHNTFEGLPPKIPFPDQIVDKKFANPNFVNKEHPSLLRHQNFYAFTPNCTTSKDVVGQKPETPQTMTTNRKRNKKSRKTRSKNRKQTKCTDKPFHKTSLVNEIYELDAVDFDLSATDPESCPAMPSTCSYVFDLLSLVPEQPKTTLAVDRGPKFCMEIVSEAEKSVFRCRVPSVCESEDSFIVFDGGDEEISEVSEEVSSESESEESLCVPLKKVRFADDRNLCEVHPMVKWSYAYQAARKGPWEEYARDRERFRKRISDTEAVLRGVLQPKHRAEVYRERFDGYRGRGEGFF